MLDTPSLPTILVQNMGLKTLPSSITDVLSTAFSAKTGPIENGCGIEKGLALKSWPKTLMTVPVASAILVEIPPLSFLTPLKFPKKHWREQKEGSFESAGRPMVQ